MKRASWSSLPRCIKEMVLTEFIYEKRVVDNALPKKKKCGGHCAWYIVKRVAISQCDMFGDHRFLSYLLPCREINELVQNHISDGMAKDQWNKRIIYSRSP